MRYKWLIHTLVVMTICLCAVGPFFGVALAGAVAEANGCQLDKGSIHTCMVLGIDRGKDLYSLGMLGWLGIATLPLGLAAFVLYLVIVLAAESVMWMRRRKAASISS